MELVSLSVVISVVLSITSFVAANVKIGFETRVKLTNEAIIILEVFNLAHSLFVFYNHLLYAVLFIILSRKSTKIPDICDSIVSV
ncbi:internalin-J [Listeria monocytogenes]|nr:internalin-J [Listeria monocytogenes]